MRHGKVSPPLDARWLEQRFRNRRHEVGCPRRRLVLGLLVFLLVQFTAPAALAATGTGPAALASQERQVTLTVTTDIVNPSDTSATVWLHIPLLSQQPSPYQRLIQEALTPAPAEVVTEGGERTARYQLTVPGRGSVRIVERYVVAARPYSAAGRNLGPQTLANAERATYLQEEPSIEADHPEIRRLGRTLTQSLSTDAAKAARIFHFVRTHLSYDAASPAANRGALQGYQAGRGVCQEYASLFVALARAAGLPSRVANGYVLLDRTGKPAADASVRAVRHQWAEYYDRQRGWVPVDPTLAASPERSVDAPAYVRENHGDRPVRGSVRGGKVRISRSTAVQDSLAGTGPAARVTWITR